MNTLSYVHIDARGTYASILVAILLALVAAPFDVFAAKKPAATAAFEYYAEGSPEINNGQRIPLTPHGPSYVLMGGGPDVDEAFRWMIKRAGIQPGTGGRLVILRAWGKDDYNPYILYGDSNKKIDSTTPSADGWVGGGALGLTSVETVVVASRAAADSAELVRYFERANAVFIAGGDQGNFIRFWKGTRLSLALDRLIAANVPIGGTSAGLAVLGGFDFAALNDTISSAEALVNPFDSRMTIDPATPDAADPANAALTLTGGFITPPVFSNVIFDSHLDSRNRMGRLVGFVSRLVEQSRSGTAGCTGGVLSASVARGVGVSVETALLVGGTAKGRGYSYSAQRVTNVSTTSESAVYFVDFLLDPTACAVGAPLSVPSSSIAIRKLADSTLIVDFDTLRELPVYQYNGVSSGVLDNPNWY